MDTVYGTHKAEIKDIVKDFINYGDAIIAALCKDTTGATVATFDRKFRIKLKKLDLSTTSFDLS